MFEVLLFILVHVINSALLEKRSLIRVSIYEFPQQQFETTVSLCGRAQ